MITSRVNCHRRPNPNAGSRRSGIAAMEFAAVLPILMAVLAATSDYCRFASTAMTVSNAARCGAGYGCMHPYDTYTEAVFLSTCRQVVINELSTQPGFNVSKATITIEHLGTAPDDRSVVTVSYPFRTVIHWAFLPRETTIVRKAALPMVR